MKQEILALCKQKQDKDSGTISENFKIKVNFNVAILKSIFCNIHNSNVKFKVWCRIDFKKAHFYIQWR